MLISLQIRNFALIENATIDFGKGLNVLSGETGAGKSILVQAIELLLGGRGSSDLVRQGEEVLDSGEDSITGRLSRLFKEIQRASEIDPRLAGVRGAEEAEFLIAPNPGEGLKPLAKIASGGEIARMLAGIRVTDKALAHAREMLRNASQRAP